MKKLIWISLFFVSSLQIFAQKNTFEFSSGYTQFGTWDLIGSNINISYQRKVSNYLSFYSQLNLSMGTLSKNLGTVDYDGYPFAIFYASNQVKKVNIGPSLKFLRDKKHSFSIEPLFSIVNYNFLSTSGFIRNLNPNVPKESLYFGLPLNHENGFALGLMGQVGYRFRIKNNFKIGLDANIQNFKGNGEINVNLVCSKSF